jgi:VCBS repeat-containing protein
VTKASGSSSGSLNMNFSAPATALDYLAEDEVLTLTYTVAVDDGDGGVTSKTFAVTITGTNDFPTITTVAGTTDVLGAVTEDTAVVGTTLTDLTDSGTLTFNDLDLTDAHTVSVSKASGTLGGTLRFGNVTESATTSAGSVPWTYTVANSATQYLAKDQTTSEVFTVTVNDGQGGTTTQNVTVTATGTNDVPIINGQVQNVLGVEDQPINLTINNFAELIDHDLADQLYIEIESILGGRLEQAVSGGSKIISEKDPTAIKLKRDADGKIALDGNLQFKPNPNVSGDAQVKYRLWDGRAYSSAIGIIPIVLAAQADQILANPLSLAPSLEISNFPILRVNARNDDLSESLIFDLTSIQGGLTESVIYRFQNNSAGNFEIDMKLLAQLLSDKVGFHYNQPIDISLKARSEDGVVLSGWTGDLITADVLAIPDVSRLIGSMSPNPTSSDQNYRKLIFGDHDFANSAGSNDYNVIAPDYEFVTSTNASFNDDLLSESLKNIFGTIGNDTIYAPEPTSGNVGSILFGSQGQDYLYGSSGNDMLIASQGFDTMRGGQGADLFVISKDVLYDQYSKVQMDNLLDTVIGYDNNLSNTLFSHFKDPANINIAGYVRDFTPSDTINFSDFSANSLSHVKLDDKLSFVYSKEANSSPVGILVNFSFSENGSFNETDFIAHQIQSA